MGAFSWLTADTEESIPVSYSPRHKGRTVYMLQPGEDPAIAEPEYEGYGRFGGKSAYVWLAERNLTADQIAAVRAGADEEMDAESQLYQIGVTLEMGKYFVHRDTGVKYSVFHPIHPATGVETVHINGTYGEPREEFGGLDANDAIKDGVIVPHPVPAPKFPLKFSFDPDAVYEDLPASKVCPNQGIYYDDDEEGEGE